MLKVFLVKDEGVIREGFRDKTPREWYGFKLAGEASDGEVALSLIRKIEPDMLLTDIKIPFMDGLSLGEIVKEEFPKMKVIIISGCDDFGYARQTIATGVDQYLLEPITRTVLRNALLEIKEKIEQEPEQKDYQTRYQDETQEFEQFALRQFFEKVLDDKLSVKEIYGGAVRKSVPLATSCYNLLLFSIYKKHESPTGELEERFMRKQGEVFHYFLRHPQYILFRLSVNYYGVLIKREPSQMELLAKDSLAYMKRICDPEEADASWYATVGMSVKRLSLLSRCYEKINHYFACRLIMLNQRILTETALASCLGGQEGERLEEVNSVRMDPKVVRDFLVRGGDKKIHDFAESYFQSINSTLGSGAFRNYVILNIRFAVVAFLESLGTDQRDYQDDIEEVVRIVHQNDSQVFEYFALMLRTAMEIRDRKNSYQDGKMLKKALGYISKNYDSDALSLNLVTEHISISANYLSAIFSQTMQETSVGYVTEERIEKARKLLKQTNKSSSEIAKRVGYKDAHCFSFIFKKQLRYSPREYHAEKKH